VDISAPRPDGGEEVTRPFTVAATDGSKETEATGSFIQESSDWRPVWRAILTLLGGALMIAGVFIPWRLFGPKGRLSRWAAAIAAVIAAGFLVSAVINSVVVARVDVGSFVVLVGCGFAFIGGYLAPRRG
jgi:hypothetical protein